MIRKRISMKKLWRSVVFIIGFVMCSYPMISGMAMKRYQENIVTTHENTVREVADEVLLSEELKKAQEYNGILYQTKGLSIEGIKDGILSEENYNRILNISDNGIMGSIEIPKVGVKLPVYHGTGDEVLDVGIGHVENSSFPVGGESTRAVLSGHRGLPNAKLFTRLDEMEYGDLFYINVLDQMLAYKVCEITVIKPEEQNALEIQEGRDLVTLVTCTPYGLNTHRLLVTGERVEYNVEEYEYAKPQIYSIRELAFSAIPFVFLAVAVIMFFSKWYKRRRKKGVDGFGKE